MVEEFLTLLPLLAGGAKPKILSYMNTDIRKTDNGTEYSIDLPGFKKEDITVSLEKGRMVVTASAQEKKEAGEENTFIAKERMTASCRRCYPVGEHISEDDICARFADGVLTITVSDKTEKAEEKKSISID